MLYHIVLIRCFRVHPCSNAVFRIILYASFSSEKFKMDKKDNHTIKQKFSVRRTAQIVIISGAIFLMLLLTAIYRRPDLFGQFSKKNLVSMQIVVILAFINVTALNWRCPSCGKYLGNNLSLHVCKHCGARLK